MARKSTKVIDKGFKKAIAELKDMFERKEVVVGVYGDKAAEQRGEDDFTMVNLAEVHEFGSRNGNIPERSFLRSTFDENVEKIAKRIVNEANNVARGQGNAKISQKRLGLFGENLVKEKIRAGIPPPNAPETIKRKGSSKPLIDTGRLINSIRYEVRNK